MSYIIATLSSILLVAVLFGLMPEGIVLGGMALPMLATGIALAGLAFVLANPRKRKARGVHTRQTGHAQMRELTREGETRKGGDVHVAGFASLFANQGKQGKQGVHGMTGAQGKTEMRKAAIARVMQPERRKTRKPYSATGTIWRRHSDNPPAITISQTSYQASSLVSARRA